MNEYYYKNIYCAYCNRVYSIKQCGDSASLSRNKTLLDKFNCIHIEECSNKKSIPEGYSCIGSISFSSEPEGKVIDVE